MNNPFQILEERLDTIEIKLNRILVESLENNTPDSQRYLTARNFCKRTNIAMQSFYNKAPKGEIPGATQFGRKWMVDIEIFEKYLTEKAAKP